MDGDKQQNEAMKLKGIEEILASEDEIVPSSGFLSAVMERVEEEARMPAPIPFPWKRALPGFVLIAAACGWGGIKLAHTAAPMLKTHAVSAVAVPSTLVQPMEQAGWVLMALTVSLASWLLARRLVGRPGLF